MILSGSPRVAVISGGLGGARVALGLKAVGLDAHTCFITNVGDDLTVDGLLVCPDTDAVLYALAGLFDEARGWGIRDDTFPAAGEGPEHWFGLGVRDYAHHARRRALLDSGLALSSVTDRLAGDLGIEARVMPATDDDVRTHVTTSDGVLAWQEWLVRDRAVPVPTGVEYRGAELATGNGDALVALRDADLVLIAPSSPIASVAPILAIPGFTEALRDRLRVHPGGGGAGADRVGVCRTAAVSPVVVRRPLVGERDRLRARARSALLAAHGLDHTPAAVAGMYREFVDTFVLDPVDVEDLEAVGDATGPGTEVIAAPAPTTTVEGVAALVQVLLGA